DVRVKETTLRGPVTVQVVDVTDIGHGAWAQVERLEMVERGETTRGREVIRTISRDESGETGTAGTTNTGTPAMLPTPAATAAATTAPTSAAAGESGSGSGSGSGPHRLVLQDGAGTLLPAFEAQPVPALALDGPAMRIGMRLVLTGVTVARGLALLEPRNVRVLQPADGGDGDADADAGARDRAWRAARKQRLLQRLAENGGG
ncbi:hypothetical protein KEM52_001925, partial [Ascosphaera acerosa]